MSTSEDTLRLAERFIGAFEGAERPQGDQREQWISMWADDAVWECPLMPQPLRLEGREQICAFMLWIMDSSPEYKVIEKTVFNSADSNEVFVEARGDGPVDGGGRYTQHYIVHFRTRDGKISHVREFLNPIAVFDGFGEERLAAAFAAF